MLYLVYFLLYFFIFMAGSCIGSFLNVLIYRIPNKIPFWKGRSFCTSCKTTIKPYDMIPIFSYHILHGKCRHCNKGISKSYPLVEAITGLIALLIYRSFDYSVLSLIYFTFSSILVAVAFIDIDTMTIPNGLIIVLLVPTLASLLFAQQPDIISRIIGFFIISLPMFLITFAIPDCFGGGDIKLIAVCGFMLGWHNTLVALFIGLIFGGIHGIILLTKDKNNRKKHIAFGQYLCVGVFTALLYGDNIIKFYLGLFGLN
ncbi:MAG: peptidase [Clostridiales bacterium GWF2_38_85]|nr:MAG: peptidase [Clostridiales bacterium GWF2_38_85]HBL84805.1 prepilin peptidase [Clostridiales bacterium]